MACEALPSVKCSSCGQPVPLANLGGHVCPPPTWHKPPMSPKLAAAFLPQRLHSLVARSITPPRRSSSVKPSEVGEHILAPSDDPFQRLPPDKSHTVNPRVPFPKSSPPPDPIPPPERTSTPHLPHRARTPSNASYTGPISPAPHGHPIPRRPSPLSSVRGPPALPQHGQPSLRPSLDARRPSPTVPSPAPTSSRPPISARQPPPPPLSLPYPHPIEQEIDTKTGGEAGMAGVGRRGFQAAARAALFAASRSPLPPPVMTLGDHSHRDNVPQYLDTGVTSGLIKRVVKTPPLSPNSIQTPSPVSPFPVSPVSIGNINGQPRDVITPHSPSPLSGEKALSHPSDVRIASPSRSPSPIPNPFERRLSGETITQSPLPGSNMTISFLDTLRPRLELGNESDDESVYTTHTDLKKDENAPISPSAESDVGLAYTQDSDDDTPVVMPMDVRRSTSKGGVKFKFPMPLSPEDARQLGGPSRQSSAPTLRSSFARCIAPPHASPVRTRSASSATHSTTKSVGALERAMETLIEEGASVSVLASGSVLASIGGPASGKSSGKPSRSNTVPGPASPEQKPPKLPSRSHTNPSHPHIHCERVGLTGEVARIRNRGQVKQRECARCGAKIEDGRWIQMDGGKVLCERCWKNMYLPKCRRCNHPIEKQAVSSRDGQLKGKYHRECFNCHTCQKPFPDKEFYVFDGKPFCAYHYHEANNSLCGAASCGQPIEGPCAVTHSGKRYHPEHLLCEFGDGCNDRLEEYWEVDGQMLCERHATSVGGWTRDPIDDAPLIRPLGADDGRMMKRMTRFIDLGATGDDDGLDFR